MNYGICGQAVVPVRSQPGDAHEMVNQLLFGDLVVIKGNVKDWLLIETFDDHYEGWADKKQLVSLSNEEFNELILQSRYYALDLSSETFGNRTDHKLLITRGALLAGYANGSFMFRNERYPYQGQVINPDKSTDAAAVEKIAQSYLGTPYLWGGRSPFGLDCSGFVQVVFKMCGHLLPRDASQQVKEGASVDFDQEARIGDLAFFGNEEGNIVHVGIVLQDKKIIHASGKVRIDQLDHLGIFNLETRQYSHNLRIIKRILV